jgi:hypothetical protein
MWRRKCRGTAGAQAGEAEREKGFASRRSIQGIRRRLSAHMGTLVGWRWATTTYGEVITGAEWQSPIVTSTLVGAHGTG